MKRSIARLIAPLAVAGMLASLAACSSGTTETPSADVKSLTVWINGDSGPNFKKLVAPFTQKTGIDVEVVSIPFASVNEKLTTAIASGNGPDVTQVGVSFLRTFADAGALLPLNDAVKDKAELAASNFPEGAATTIDGKYYGVPWTSDTRVLFYRSDLLKEAGIDKAPTTWADVRADAATLAKRGPGQFGYYIPQWDSSLPVAMTRSNGDDVVGADGKLSFNTGAFNEAADTYLGLYQDGSVPKNADFDQVQGFVSGAAPMLVSGPYFASAVKAAAPELDGKWGVATFPKGSESSTSLFAGSDMGVWAKTTKKQAALDLVSYLSQPDTQLNWYKLSGDLPALSAALNDESIKSDPFASVYTEQLKTAKALPSVPNWDGGVGADLLTGLNSVALQGADRNTTLEAFYTKAAQQSSK